MSHDDLAIDLPADRDAPAIQLLNTSGPAGGSSRANTHGSLPPFPSPNRVAKTFTRYRSSSSISGSSRPIQPIHNLLNGWSRSSGGKLLGGWGGGDAQLTSPYSLWLDGIRTGQWCLLSAWLGTGPNRIPLFKWYRIVSVEDEVQPPDRGGLFPLGHIGRPRLGSQPRSPPDPNSNTSVSLFDGAIAVYEKTMRIDGASLYSGP